VTEQRPLALSSRITAGIVFCLLHLAVFIPTIGEPSSVLQNDFELQAQAIKDGDLPYRDQELEYPPLSIPVLVGPAYLGEGQQAFIQGFQWEMIVFDLAIVLLLALALPGDARRVLSALGVYTLGVILLSSVLLDDSLIDGGPLALARFDLVPAMFVLAAVLARDAARSATWSALLSVGAAVKAFPLLLYPVLLRGERNLARVAVAGAVPLLACVAIVLAWGDDFSSAITFHTERTLQVESLAASFFEIAHLYGAGASTTTGHGGFEIRADGVEVARWLSVLIGAVAYLALVRAGWRSRVSNLELVTALLTVLVLFGPVLSPQFMLWILPLSAAAYGFGRENVTLLVAILLTQIVLQNYDGVEDLRAAFVWPVALRNATLLVYLWMVCAPILRPGGEPAATPGVPRAERSGSPA